MLPLQRIQEMDEELARVARSGGALRLHLGMGLQAWATRNGPLEMGFSSLEAYALERCGRSVSWVRESRNLALALDKLPLIRRGLLAGRIRWATATLIARHVCTEDEPLWAEEAARRTFREMRWLVLGPRAPFMEDGAEESISWTDDSPRTLSLTVDREDAWLYECARKVVGRVGGHHATADEVVGALVAEGSTTLQSYIPEEKQRGYQAEEGALRKAEAAQRAWEAQLALWRDQAEARCEPRPPPLEQAMGPEMPGAEKWLFEASLPELDAKIRKLADELAARDITLGRLSEAFWRADGWRRLGYASPKQYAAERLGMGLSSIKEKQMLSRRLEKMPALERALREQTLCYEAARLIAKVATPETVEEWVRRAEERTVKHLREETDIAEVVARLSYEPAVGPPSEKVVHEVQAIEGRIGSGAAFLDRAADPTQEGQISVRSALDDIAHVLGSLFHPLDRAHTGSRTTRSRGRVTLRLRVKGETYREYRRFERLFRRFGPRGESFLRFVCLTLIDTWKHMLGTDVAYGQIYARDRFQCRSPVCCRRDVTPHHLQYRSAGGGDGSENIASLCVACHLEGVHRQRIKASPPASRIRWALGRAPHTIVIGRRKLRGISASAE